MDAGLNARVARKKPILTLRHKELRLDFAREHQDWTWVDWSVVIFTDESKFTHYRMMVGLRRRVGEALLPECIAPTVTFGGGGGVMVWGALTARGPGLLKTVRGNLNGVRYIDILGDCMVPSAHLHGYRDHYIFQDDNAPCHRARIVNEWKAENNISSLQWPAQNPIENLWSQLGRMIHRDSPADLQYKSRLSS